MKLLENIATAIDEQGNSFLDDFLIPALLTSKDKAIETTHLNALTSFKKYSDEIKIKNFIYATKELGYLNTISDIQSFSSSQKFFLLESLQKVINLNDFVQISLEIYLIDEYLKNNENFSYWQKSLYYNLNNLTEDDFRIFCSIMENSKENDKDPTYYTLDNTDNNKGIVLDKFTNMGILQPNEKVVSNVNLYFRITEHTKTFYKVLINIFSVQDKSI